MSFFFKSSQIYAGHGPCMGVCEVLLHLIFRPYNTYCIYVGSNAKSYNHESIQQLVDCYQKLYPQTNIFMAKNTSNVSWGSYNLLDADLKCIEQMLKLKSA